MTIVVTTDMTGLLQGNVQLVEVPENRLCIIDLLASPPALCSDGMGCLWEERGV